MARIEFVAPQFLVDDLSISIAFYENTLGFQTEFTYEGFYAGLARDGAHLHLKCAPKAEADRLHRRDGNHLDALFEVSGVEELQAECKKKASQAVGDVETHPWKTRDFIVTDPDGYRLCFTEPAEE
jgi:catechol 2,3-dioxygenase-like lactoylglutathione lyase family enzyme